MATISELEKLHRDSKLFLMAIERWMQSHPLQIGIDSLRRHLSQPADSELAKSFVADPNIGELGSDSWPRKILKFKAIVLEWFSLGMEHQVIVECWNILNADNMGQYGDDEELTVMDLLWRVGGKLLNVFSTDKLERAIASKGWSDFKLELSDEWRANLQESFEHSPGWVERMETNCSLFLAFNSADYRLGDWSPVSMEKALEREWRMVKKNFFMLEKPKTDEELLKGLVVAYMEAEGTSAEKEAAIKHLIPSKWKDYQTVKSKASKLGINQKRIREGKC